MNSEPKHPLSMRGGAYHEAGHAVAYLVRERELKCVCLGDDGTGGTVPLDGYGLNEITYGRASGTIACREIETEIIVSYAGPAAEARFIGVDLTTDGMERPEGFDGYPFGHLGDLQQVRDYASREPTWRYPEKHLERLLRSAKWLVRQHWCAIEELARELLRSRELSGARCRELFDRYR